MVLNALRVLTNVLTIVSTQSNKKLTLGKLDREQQVWFGYSKSYTCIFSPKLAPSSFMKDLPTLLANTPVTL